MRMIVFLIMVFSSSWGLWIWMALPGHSMSTALLAAGAFSPSVIGVLVSLWKKTPAERHDFYRRAAGFSLIKSGWYAVILLLFPAITALSIITVYTAGYPIPSPDNALTVLTQPGTLAVFILLMIIGGPLAEEFGWRGFCLDYLQNRMYALPSAIVLGAMWTVWHFPLFFVKGTTQYSIGFGSNECILWCAQVMLLSIIYAWVFNNTGRSIISAILLHVMWNTSGTIIHGIGGSLSAEIELARTLCLVITVSLIVLKTGLRLKTPHQDIR